MLYYSKEKIAVRYLEDPDPDSFWMKGLVLCLKTENKGFVRLDRLYCVWMVEDVSVMEREKNLAPM